MVQSESRTKITDGIFEIRERFFRSHLFPVGTRHLDEAVHLPDRRNEVGDERLQLPVGIIRFLPLFLSPPLSSSKVPPLSVLQKMSATKILCLSLKYRQCYALIFVESRTVAFWGGEPRSLPVRRTSRDPRCGACTSPRLVELSAGPIASGIERERERERERDAW